MMERKVLFLQSVLILLGVSHVTNACTCDMIGWEEALCPERGKTGPALAVCEAWCKEGSCGHSNGGGSTADYDGFGGSCHVVRATAISMERLNNEGNVVDAEASAPNARYQMRLEQTFATGSTPLNVKNGIFTMMFPLANYLCGHPMTLNIDYVIVGMVYQNRILNSNKCQLILPMDDDDDDILSLLSKSDCRDLEDLATIADP